MTTLPPKLPPLVGQHLGFLDALDEAVVLVEGERVVAVNAACAKLLRIDAQRAIGRSAIEVLRHHRLEWLVLHGGEAELELAERTVLARGVLGQPSALVLRDVSQERQRERELREVMAVLSHEFRTPVAALYSILEALALEPPLAQRQRFLEIAGRETKRLVRLVEDLTVGFRPRVERLVALGDSVERVQIILGQALSERRIRLHCAHPEAMLYADPDKLVQVLLNLVENALRYGPQPGTVVVACQPGPASSHVVAVVDGGARLPDYQGLFAAHYRGPNASDSNPGTGMGLYIVRLIVEGWGGKVWGDFDEQHQGNGFYFTVSPG
jgi:signal transduction histidine kinase